MGFQIPLMLITMKQHFVLFKFYNFTAVKWKPSGRYIHPFTRLPLKHPPETEHRGQEGPHLLSTLTILIRLLLLSTL